RHALHRARAAPHSCESPRRRGVPRRGARRPHRGRRGALRMGFYPIVLELEGRPCLVVGGGAVAERKVESLLEAGARITVVSPTATPRLQQWNADGRIALRLRPFAETDVTGQLLVIAATDHSETQREARTAGARHRVPVNV